MEFNVGASGLGCMRFGLRTLLVAVPLVVAVQGATSRPAGSDQVPCCHEALGAVRLGFIVLNLRTVA